MKVKLTVSIGLVGCMREETVDLDDDMTDEELDEYWRDWMLSKIGGTWKKLPETIGTEG
jgi:hypothetical protein